MSKMLLPSFNQTQKIIDYKPEDEHTTGKIKRRRTDVEEHQPNVLGLESPNQFAIAALPDEENDETQIFKLVDDCVQEMFDWLSIRNIHSVAGTCTRMQRIAGGYFQPHLAALQLVYDGEFKKSFYDRRNLNEFTDFVQKLKIIDSVNDEGYRFIGMRCTSLKQIYFNCLSQLTVTRIEYIKPILSKIETVIFDKAILKCEFYNNFLQSCSKLKHLRIKSFYSKPIIGDNNEWLLQNYPKLEHLEMKLIDVFGESSEIPELGGFFETNLTLQKLSIDGDTFVQNINAMLQAKLKLQVLALDVYKDEEIICHRLHQLHNKGFYQRLHLKVCANQEIIERISSSNGMEMLYLYMASDTPRLNLNLLTNLKELGFYGSAEPTAFSIDLQSTAKSLVNLQRLNFPNINTEIIEPFIEYAAELKAIKVEWLDGEKFINLAALNKKREKLLGARKVTIYLNEKAYLATKWNNKTINMKMIEVKRAESYDWQSTFTI